MLTNSLPDETLMMDFRGEEEKETREQWESSWGTSWWKRIFLQCKLKLKQKCKSYCSDCHSVIGVPFRAATPQSSFDSPAPTPSRGLNVVWGSDGGRGEPDTVEQNTVIDKCRNTVGQREASRSTSHKRNSRLHCGMVERLVDKG